tara:strand:- start:161 stop:592 length:432 start_codon:yes stop_codon:yes gene_type:complete
MNHNRPEWDDVWMQYARIIATRSYDPRTQVGAIIVSEDNTTVLSLGYNGNYPSGPNMPDSIEPGKSGFIHAEINALIKAPFHYHKDKVMYVTLSPCIQCAKMIITAGIKKVVYDEEYRNTEGIDLLKKENIIIEHYKNTKQID